MTTELGRLDVQRLPCLGDHLLLAFLNLALDFLQPYTRNGTGDAAFDFLTLDRQQVRIQGQYTGNSGPFVVSIDNETLVDERLGASHNNTTFEGTFTIGAGTAAIESSPGVAWSFTEIR